MNRILLSAAALAAAVPATAQVQAPLAPVAPRTDVTQTRDQVVAKVRDHFAKMDSNRDGFVGSDEMRSMRGQHQRMKHGGNRMAEDGVPGSNPGGAFDRLDSNRDGMISRDEFAKGREIRVERMVVMNGAPGALGAMNGEHRGMRMMHRMGGRAMGGRMMKMADLNQDGRVSLQEATASALQRFDRVDTNRDGRITPDERRQNRDLRRQSRAPTAG